MLHINIKIYGLVQGVFFRAGAKDKADTLNIKGFIKNMPDGSVYIEAEGRKNNLDEFLSWCKKGPDLSKVERIKTSEGPLKNFNSFEVT